jgi:hypothetical protein
VSRIAFPDESVPDRFKSGLGESVQSKWTTEARPTMTAYFHRTPVE